MNRKGGFFMNEFIFAMLFLYFPEDKSEYIPAFLSLSVFLIACILVFVWVRKISRKEEERARQLEKQLKYAAESKQQENLDETK